MPKNYVLIDYENVQPSEIPLLPDPENFFIKLFLGPGQSKLPTSLTKSLQPLGTNVEYHELKEAGANALDFYVAYMLGVLTTEEPGASFHIISKNKGFQPLVSTLRARKLHIYLCPSLAEIPCLRPGPAKTPVTKAPAAATKPAPSAKKKPAAPVSNIPVSEVARAVAHLANMKNAKPRKRTTLKSSLLSHFKTTHNEAGIDLLIDTLSRTGTITEDTKGAVTYHI